MNQNHAAVNAFFVALETHDLEKVRPVLADQVTEVIPLGTSGSLEPFAVYEGRDAVLGYLGQIITMLSRSRLVDRVDTVSEDGDTIFVEARGDLINAQSGAAYRNIYVFKFQLGDGLITHIAEYANPVTFAQTAGLPLG